MKALLLSLTLLLSSSSTAAAAVVKLTAEQAVRLALRNNLSLKTERLTPALSTAAEKAARASFDPVLFGDLAPQGSVGGVTDDSPSGTAAVGISAGLRKTFITGTSIDARVGGSMAFDPTGTSTDSPVLAGSLSVGIRQPLLRGRGSVSARTAIGAAQLSRAAAEHDLRRKAELVAAEALAAFWDLHHARSGSSIARQALLAARRTAAETATLIRSGRVSSAEGLEVRYRAQVRTRELHRAETDVRNAAERLARAIGLTGRRSFHIPAVEPVAAPHQQQLKVDLTALLKVALARRGDHQSLLQRSRIEAGRVAEARHKLLPKLDLLGSAGLTTGNSLRLPSTASTSAGSRMEWSVGLTFELPLGNRSARSAHELALLASRKARGRIRESEQQVAHELGQANRELVSAWQLLQLARRSAVLASTREKNQLQRYRLGRGSAQLLALAQDELVKERLALAAAIAAYNKAIVALRRAAGTLIRTITSTRTKSGG